MFPITAFPKMWLRAAVATFYCVALAVPVSAQELDTDGRRAVIEAVTGALDQAYVFPEVATAMAKHVRGEEERGAYENLGDPGEFAVRLTEDLRSVSKDLHLWVRPMREAELEGEKEISEEERRARRLEQLRLGNGGFKKLEILEGNVGYLDLRGFADAGEAGHTAHAAMTFLSQADALIVDLRQNGGGSPSMIQLITSYFFDEPQHLNSFYLRAEDTTKQFWTQSHLPGPRMVDTPIWVLTSGRTFSAAEEFSYNLRHMERATLVGETTGGGAHPVEIRRFPELRMEMSVPFGRAINPITGTNWEGTGVEPHVPVEAGRAKDVAYALALDEILKSLGDDEDRARRVRWAKEAAVPGPELSREEKQALVGTYGPRIVALDGDRLTYRRGKGPVLDLVAVGKDRYRVDGVEDFRVRFERDGNGNVVTLVGLYGDGREEPHGRE